MRLEVSIGPDGLSEPVTFARLVRSHLAVDLSAAKRILDDLTERKSVTLCFDDHAAGDAFRGEVSALGLLVRELAASALVPSDDGEREG